MSDDDFNYCKYLFIFFGFLFVFMLLTMGIFQKYPITLIIIIPIVGIIIYYMKKIIKEQIENLKGLYAFALTQFIFMFILVFLFFFIILIIGIGFLIVLYPLTLIIIIPIVSIIIFRHKIYDKYLMVWYKRREKRKKKEIKYPEGQPKSVKEIKYLSEEKRENYDERLQ